MAMVAVWLCGGITRQVAEPLMSKCVLQVSSSFLDVTALEWMGRVSFPPRWRRLSPAGASNRSPAICAGCVLLTPRRRSRR